MLILTLLPFIVHGSVQDGNSSINTFAGEVIFAVEGDAAATGQQDKEARIGSLAYALKKPDNASDAIEDEF